MNGEKIHIIIVDDHKMIRETWKMILQREDKFIVISECSSGLEAINAAADLKPDVILMDINMTPVNGFEATQKILENNPAIKVIGISINNQPVYARHMMQLGAKGYVTKNSSREEMVEAILEVHKGGTYLCKEIRDLMP